MDHSFGSIFTGIGAGDYGLEQAGWRCRWQTEPDPFRRTVLDRHWPDLQRFWDVKACLASPPYEVPPVELVYGELPNTDPTWWEEIFPLVAVLQTPLWLLEASPVAFDLPEQAGLIARFGTLGYWATAKRIGFSSRMRGRILGQEIVCTLKRQRLFLLAGRDRPPMNIQAIDEFNPPGLISGAAPVTLTPKFDERPILDEVEALVGLPVGWSCLCGQSPCTCGGRIGAVNEATVTHLLEWIGTWLRACTPA